MTPSSFIEFLVLGLLAGALGQVIRQIGSVKKLTDEHPSESVAGHFDSTRFGINVMVGAAAGALGVLTLMPEKAQPMGDLRQTFFTLIGIGYAGADFIEAFMRRSHVPTTPKPGAVEPTASNSQPASSQ